MQEMPLTPPVDPNDSNQIMEDVVRKRLAQANISHQKRMDEKNKNWLLFVKKMNN